MLSDSLRQRQHPLHRPFRRTVAEISRVLGAVSRTSICQALGSCNTSDPGFRNNGRVIDGCIAARATQGTGRPKVSLRCYGFWVAHLLRVDGAQSAAWKCTSMVDAGLTEVVHLEAWIKAHPEVIDGSLLVVTTQFTSWASQIDFARERPDVLALSSSGELVVIELKRDGDRRIHLQAITYAALAGGFTKEVLAQAHAAWLSSEYGESVTVEVALDRLTQHVESAWSDSVRHEDLLAGTDA